MSGPVRTVRVQQMPDRLAVWIEDDDKWHELMFVEKPVEIDVQCDTKTGSLFWRTHPQPKVAVDRDFLVRVDSLTSYVGHRGLDDVLRKELQALSAEARRLYE